MNKVILIGRLVKDPEVKTTQSQIAFCGFTVAVDRKFKKDGEKTADFISCVAWRQQAEFLGKYFQKGSRLAIIGNLQNRSYDDKDGKKIYVTEVVVDEIEFIDSKKDGQGGIPATNNATGNIYMPATPVLSSDNGFYPSYDEDTVLPFDL